MITLIVKLLINALAIFLVGSFLPGIHVSTYITALIVALVLGILNLLVRPILFLITLPINILTLGLFTFILNGLMFWLVSLFIVDFKIDGFWWAVIGSLIVSVISTIGDRLFLGADQKVGGN